MSDGRASNGGLRHPAGGRPRWQPTPDVRREIFDLATRGVPQEHIALFVNISESTLKRRCAEELKLGALGANAAVAFTAYQMAVSGEHPEMTRFWLRALRGWRQTGDVPSHLPIVFSKIEGED